MAVSHAIDRETIVPALMGITGAPWYQMLGPQVNGYIPGFDETDALKYDPEKAKELLAAAKADGHPVETEFVIITQARHLPGQARRSFRLSRQNLEEVGFKFKLLSMELQRLAQISPRSPFPPEQRRPCR